MFSVVDATVSAQTEATSSVHTKLFPGGSTSIAVQPPDVAIIQSPRAPPVCSSTPVMHPERVGGTSTPCETGTQPSGSSPQLGKPLRMMGPVQNRKTPLQGPPPWRPPCEGMMPPFRGMHSMGPGGPQRPLLPFPNGHPMHQR